MKHYATKLKQVLNTYRRRFRRRRDFKQFLCEGRDLSQLELDRSSETGRPVEL